MMSNIPSKIIPNDASRAVLVFAHIPPPHHGQAVMVGLLLEGLRADPAFTVFHVNARVSDDIEDVGGIRPGKIIRLFRFCLETIRIRLRHGPMDIYYVPAPAKKSAVVRDWIVMLFVRPWFRRIIFHWHAFGLGHWATGNTEYPSGPEQAALPAPNVFGYRVLDRLARWLTRRLLANADLSIVLTEYNRRDAELLSPKSIAVVPNGIPDPCLDFETSVLSERLMRFATRQQSASEDQSEQQPPAVPLRCLFLGHCLESKGLHTAAGIVAEYCALTGRPVHFVVAGEFASVEDRSIFESLIGKLGISLHTEIFGFADRSAKARLLAQADVLLFPTKYPEETFGLVVLEAMAFGLPSLVTRWRGIPSLLPTTGLFEMLPGDTKTGAKLLEKAAGFSGFGILRARFLECFTDKAHIRRMSGKMKVET